MAPRALDRVGEWLDGQTVAWRWVDPETFTQACIELQVWESWAWGDALEALADCFEENEVTAAALRFLNVASALDDETLAEFMYDTDDGKTAIPTAIFWTAATAPYDDVEEKLEPCAWRRAILARIEAEG